MKVQSDNVHFEIFATKDRGRGNQLLEGGWGGKGSKHPRLPISPHDEKVLFIVRISKSLSLGLPPPEREYIKAFYPPSSHPRISILPFLRDGVIIIYYPGK